MIVSIMQPAYLPWLGYFDRLRRSDLHIVLDSVPLGTSNRNNFTARNRVRVGSANAAPVWLSVPLMSGQHDTIIRDVVLADQPGWARKHAATLRHAYARAAHGEYSALMADRIEAAAQAQYALPSGRLLPLLDVTTAALREWMGITTPTVSASTLHVSGAKSGLILALCQQVGATTYLSGPFGRDYLDLDAFTAAGIRVAFHDYMHPVYPQAGAGFVPYLSAIDLVANLGPASRDVLSASGALPGNDAS